MGITVNNTTADSTRVLLVDEMMDGSFDAKVMAETDVPYTKYWDDELEQRIVYLNPDPEQLKAIVAALNDRRLSLDALQDLGGSDGGTSDLPL